MVQKWEKIDSTTKASFWEKQIITKPKNNEKVDKNEDNKEEKGRTEPLASISDVFSKLLL